MKQFLSEFGKINYRDIIRSFFNAMITTGIGAVIVIVNSGKLPTKDELIVIGYVALGAGLGTIGVKTGTNSDGKFLKKEDPVDVK